MDGAKIAKEFWLAGAENSSTLVIFGLKNINNKKKVFTPLFECYEMPPKGKASLSAVKVKMAIVNIFIFIAFLEHARG